MQTNLETLRKLARESVAELSTLEAGTAEWRQARRFAQMACAVVAKAELEASRAD
jgi:hypothetical protein